MPFVDAIGVNDANRNMGIDWWLVQTPPKFFGAIDVIASIDTMAQINRHLHHWIANVFIGFHLRL